MLDADSFFYFALMAVLASGLGWGHAAWQGRRLAERARQLENQLIHLQSHLAVMEELATHDRLTGAWNRRRFEEAAAAEMALAARRRAPVSLILLDLDHFKRVNDAFGHGTGDEVLKGAGRVFRQALRTADSLTRWGGEEFIVLSPATTLKGALNLAERIRRALAEEVFPIAGTVTLSAGVAEYLEGESIEAWVERADQALYHAKESGRNRVEAHPGHASDTDGDSGSLVELFWDPAYASGNASVDGQHRLLFELANRLLSALLFGLPAAQVDHRLKALLDHVARHFSDEEDLLRAVAYPGLEPHQREHARLLQQAQTLRAEVEEGRQETGRLVSYVICDLVRDHIINEDRHYFPHLQESLT